jgi:hypothetical protein
MCAKSLRVSPFGHVHKLMITSMERAGIRGGLLLTFLLLFSIESIGDHQVLQVKTVRLQVQTME